MCLIARRSDGINIALISRIKSPQTISMTKTATGLVCSTAMSPIGLPTPQATMEAIMANSGLLFRIVPQVSRITRELVKRANTC